MSKELIIMAIGLACGSFNFIIAIIVTVVVMVVLTVFRKIEQKVNKNSPYFLVTCEKDVPVMSIILDYAKENKMTVSNVSTELVEGMVQAVFKLNPENNVEVDVDKIETEIRQLTKAVAIQALNRH